MEIRKKYSRIGQ